MPSTLHDASPLIDDDSRHLPVQNTPGEVELYRRVRGALDSGQFEEGDRLPPERELAEHYGASRHLIRRAIQRLENEKRLIRAVGKGTFVARPAGMAVTDGMATDTGAVSPIDVLEARMVIEPGFSDLLVARATPNDLRRLDDLLGTLVNAKTQQEFREAGYAFHLGLAQTTRNPLLIKIFEMIVQARASAGWGRLQSLNDTPAARQAQAKSNQAILSAIKDRDADLTRKLMRGHLSAMLSAVAYSPER